MLVLAINTATARTAIALIKKTGKETETLYANAWDSQHDEAEKLLPEIKKILKKKSADAIFVVEGPGAFTSLRVGVTAANVLAYVLGAPIYAVSTFDLLRASIHKSYKKNTMLIMRGGGDFIAVLPPNRKKEKRIGKNDLGKFVKKLKSVSFAVTDMSAEEKKKIDLPANVKWLEKANISPFERAAGHLLENKIRAKKQVVPRYLLPPKITISKKEVFV
jgi:tRNA threonylcarbamoyl adenosine modification protein YeaZ